MYLRCSRLAQGERYDFSPFKVKTTHGDNHQAANAEKKASVEREPETAEGRLKRITALHGWLPPSNSLPAPPRQVSNPSIHHYTALSRGLNSPTKQNFVVGKDLIPIEQRNMKQAVERSLSPELSEKEAGEYER